MTIVLCSKGYPGNYKRGQLIKNINKLHLKNNEYIFHAGTKFENGNIISVGGRVLNFTSFGENLLKIRRNLIKLIKKLNWKNGFFRNDIGWKIINHENNKWKI